MGYDICLSKVADETAFEDENALWYECGWEWDNVYDALGRVMKGEPDAYSFEVDLGKCAPLRAILDIIAVQPMVFKNDPMTMLRNDFATYRRLCGLCSYGEPHDWLDGIGKERQGLMRSAFFVGDKDLLPLADALCGATFDASLYCIEHVIEFLNVLTSNEHKQVFVHRSY